MYELFEHTADVGLRVRASTLDALFAEAGTGLASVIVEHVAAIRPTDRHAVRLAADSLEHLLLDWLDELLFLFETKGVLLARFEVRVSGTRLEADAFGEPYDPIRHGAGLEVKAITYHGLKLETVADGYLAEVILDI